MTVSSATNKAGPYLTNGVTTQFSFPFRLLQAADLKVYRTDTTTAQEDLLSSGYSISLVNGGVNGATVTVSPALPTGYKITLVREVNYLQDDFDPTAGSSYYADVLEGAMDKRVMQIQQLKEAVDRAIKIPVSAEGVSTDLPAPLAGHVIGSTDGLTYENLQLVDAGQAIAGNWTVDRFVAGVGFTAGVSTSVALSKAPASAESILVSFDGVIQHRVTYSVTGTTLNFTSAIPGGVSAVEVRIPTTLAVGAPSDGAVTSALVTATGSTAERSVGDRFADVVNVKDFGAVGDGVTDDYAAIMAAYAALSYFSNNDGGGNTYYGFQGRLYFPKGRYAISQTLVLPNAYLDVDGDGSILIPFSGFDQNTFALDLTSLWTGKVTNLKLAKFTKNIRVYNPNLDAGCIEFDRVEITGGSIGFDIDCRSTFTRISNFRLDNVKQPLILRNGDRVQFRHGWMNAGVVAANYDGMFVVDSNTAPTLELVDLFYVPAPQSVTKPCVVKVVQTARVIIDRCLFGGEAGQIPLIGNHASAATYTSRGSRFIISNTMAYVTTRGMVELFAIPNSIAFHNVNGMVDEAHTYGLISYATDFLSYSAAKAAMAAGAKPEFHITGFTPENYFGLSGNERAQLSEFVASRNKIYHRALTGVTNVAYGVISELNGNSLNRGQTYRVCLTNQDNPGADRYSEYIVAGDYGGSGPSLVSIILGASVVAPRVSVVGAEVRVLTNGATGPNEIRYSVERLCSPCEGYP
jgi:hypothetical protein